MTTLTQSEEVVLEWLDIGSGVTINKKAFDVSSEQLLTPEAVKLVATLHRELEPVRQKLLAERRERQVRYDSGEVPTYLPKDSEAASENWKVAPIPKDLLRRRVEITGPVNNTKMVINMLSRNSDGDRADTAMLDFEDSMKPSWTNVVQGLHNLIGAVDGTLSYLQPAADGQPEKVYTINPDDMPVIMTRVRGLHLDESNLRVDGETVSGGLLDFALSAYHTAGKQAAKHRTAKYYVPKCEAYLEARWWNQLFTSTLELLALPKDILRATFLMETLPAAFQMEEILYEIRSFAAGLNVGRWDKIFSDIKVLRNHKDRVMADRATIGLNRPWMKNYAMRLIKICHSRGAFAMGGMAAFTPGKTAELRREQTGKVRQDKEFEAEMGHDGCWVSHPYFIGVAMSAFKRDNQLDVMLEDFDKYPELLPEPVGVKTLAGLRKNVRVGIAYTNGWNQDIGCVAWDNLMEDLATLEISRAQVWQWLHNRVMLEDGQTVTPELVKEVFEEELEKIKQEVVSEMEGQSEARKDKVLKGFVKAKEEAEALFTKETFDEFFSLKSQLV